METHDSTFTCGDLLVRYVRRDQVTELNLLPAHLAGAEAIPRNNLDDSDDGPHLPWKKLPARSFIPLIEVCRVQDIKNGGESGNTYRRSGCQVAERRQRVSHDNGLEVITELVTPGEDLLVEHHLVWKPGWESVRVHTEICVTGPTAQTLEAAPSFLLAGITPFAADDAPGRLFLHRFGANWSAEGRHLCESIENLGLERSWVPWGERTMRFGQTGSKPTQRWIPWLAIEDRGIGVLWAVHLEALGSWQFDLVRFDDRLSISGGLADRDCGHWCKTLKPGERFVTPAAWLTAVQGDLDDVCARLVNVQTPDRPSPVEADLPIIFNEWCTTWGDPRHDTLMRIADRLRGTPCRYLVIDAGWYRTEDPNWGACIGTWKPSTKLFPQGLEVTTAALRERGLIPGLWFEFEAVGKDDPTFAETPRLLHRDGLPLTNGQRRFLDLRQETNHQILEQRVLDLIGRCGIGYVKVDYNSNIGIGVDGAESLGEGLRQHLEGTARFFRRMRERFPALCIECCASGGQRLTAAYARLADQFSNSDAHVCPDIPVIAANCQRYIPARTNQIWAVLMPSEDERRLVYSLAATFLGRMCLSGKIYELSETQWSIARSAMDLYRRAWPIIASGRIRRTGRWNTTMRRLRGYQAVINRSSDGRVLVVIHAFGEGAAPDPITIPRGLAISGRLASDAMSATIRDDRLLLPPMPAWSGIVLLLEPAG